MSFASLLPWRQNTEHKPEQLDDLIAEAQQRAADLEASIPGIALAVADDEPGAMAKLRQVRADQREAVETAQMLLAAREEHVAREAKRKLVAAQQRHKANVAAMQRELSASVKAAERLAEHFSAAVTAYQEMLDHRAAARKHTEAMQGFPTDTTMLTWGATRQAVAAEVYRLGAILNSAGQNHGFPGPSVATHSAAGNPSSIPPLVKVLADTNAWAVQEAERKAPA